MTSLEQDYGPLIDTLLGQAFFSDNKTFIIYYKYSFIRNHFKIKEEKNEFTFTSSGIPQFKGPRILKENSSFKFVFN